MKTTWLTRNDPLGTASRLRLRPMGPHSSSISLTEAAALLFCGAAAALAVSLLDFNLKLPGHAILRGVFPMALGLALVPRNGAGAVMGLGAITTASVMLLNGFGDNGLGSLTSLFLVGPLLDLSIKWSSPGKRVHLALASAGVLANLAAMIMQLVAKSVGWSGGGGKSVAAWLPLAIVTYPTFGAAAGLISAAMLFRWRTSHEDDHTDVPS